MTYFLQGPNFQADWMTSGTVVKESVVNSELVVTLRLVTSTSSPPLGETFMET